MAGLDQGLDQRDDLPDRPRGERLGIGAPEPECVGVSDVCGGHLARVSSEGSPACARRVVDLVVDVGDVDDERRVESLVLEKPLQEGEDHERSRVTDVDASIDGRPAGIDPHLAASRGSSSRSPLRVSWIRIAATRGCYCPSKYAYSRPQRIRAIRGREQPFGPVRWSGFDAGVRGRAAARGGGGLRLATERYLGADPGFHASYRIELDDLGLSWAVELDEDSCQVGVSPERDPDVVIGTDAATWLELREGKLSGLDAFRSRRLWARGNLDLAVAFEGFFKRPNGRPPLLRIHEVRAGKARISTLTAGDGVETVILIHGLGSNKTSFFETVSALTPQYTVHAIDLPGFGSSSKPLRAPYDAAWFARAVCRFMDARGSIAPIWSATRWAAASRSRSACGVPSGCGA